MAKSSGQVTKIYELRTLGYKDLSKELENVANLFTSIKKAKLSAQGRLVTTTDINEVKKLADEINHLKVEEQQLRVERQRMLNEQKAAQIQRQVAIDQQKAAKAANIGEAGSIAAIRKEIRELNAALILKNQKGTSTIDFRGEILTIDQATIKMKQLTAAEQEFRRQFAADTTLVGEYTTGIVNAFKKMGLDDLIAGQVTKTQQRLNDLNGDFDRLQKELQETRAAGQSTDTIERQMIENRNEVIKLDTSLAKLKTDLRGVGDIGNQVSTSISNGFKSLKGQVAQFALQYIGITALISKTQQGLSEAKLSSDLTTDLQIQLDATEEETLQLIETLKKINTRTTLAGLQEIANIALRAGVTSENIAGVTEAIDKVKVAFGKDFGSVEVGTETFAKLINIFFKDGQITGERILTIGNSIRALANETVASVPFLTDFSGRMAGVKQIANITLPDILGLGAGFEQFKQSAEVSSTVLVKVIPKLATDTQKFADIVGITKEQFSELLENNPAEALIRVAESLVKSGAGIEEISNSLADSELGSGRITSIIATLGGKADVFRERIARAGVTMQDTAAISDAFQKKNTNLAASMDRLNKRFSDFFASKNFQIVLSAISGLLLLIIGNLPLLITLVGLLTASWAAQNITLVSLRAQLILYNLGIGANLVLMGVLRVANLAYIATMFVLNGAYGLVTRAAAFFNLTISKTPLGLILTGVTLLVTAFKAFGEGLFNTTNSLKQNNIQLRINRDIAREAAKATSDQRAEAKLLAGVVRDLSISEATRMATLEKLIALDPVFQKTLVDGKINYDELNKALNTYNTNLLRSAEIEAAKARQAKEFAQLTGLAGQRQDIETALSSGDFSQLEGESKEFFEKVLFSQIGLTGVPNSKTFKKAAAKAVQQLNNEIKKQADIVDAAQKSFNEKLKEGDQGKTPGVSIVTPALKTVEVDVNALKKAVDDYDIQIQKFKGSQKDLDKLIAQRTAAQKKLDAATGKKDQPGPAFRGSRLTGEQKDDFKDIEALRDEELAKDQILFQKREITEEQHLNNVLDINVKAIDAKLKLLKGANAEERKQISQLQLERLTLEQQTNNKIFELREQLLKNQLDEQIKNIQEEDRRIQEDPTLSEEEKAQAKLNADKKILDLQIQFNAAIDALEKLLNQNSLTNAKEGADAVRKTRQEIFEDERAIAEAQLKDISNAGDKQRAQFVINYEKLRQNILNNDKLTATQRKKALEKLAKLHNVTILSSELAQLTIEFEKIKKLYEQGLKSEKEFLEAKAAMEKKATDLSQAKTVLSDTGIDLPSGANTQKILTEKLSKAFGFEEGGDNEAILGEVLAQSFDLAQQAMNNYFDAERERIQDSLELNIQRLELEKDQMLAKAQSKEEEESIERQFEAKKRKAQQDAGEQLKKVKKAEAKIALATELANIAVQASQYPFPASLIIGGILTALALGRYALNVAAINKEKFAFGGKPGEVPSRGGQFGGKPHSKGGTDFSFRGERYNAEAKELAVIRTKDAPKGKRFSVTGTQMEIASAINKIGGGINFKPGAKLVKFETGGFLGDRLQPPVFTPSNNFINNSGGISEEKFDELIEKITEMNTETSKRIDRIQTVVSDKEITDAQNKRAKQTSIGTL